MIGENLSNKLISVLVVDDHLLIRESYERLLKNYNFIGEIQLAESGEQAIEKLKKQHFDVVLMDNSMPNGMHGVDATLWISQNLPNVKVIGITNFEIGKTGIEFVIKGAKGFFEKGLAHEFLEKAILTVYNGGTFLSEEVMTDLKYYGLREDNCKKVELDEREFLIVKALSEAKSTKYIAAELGLKVRRVEQLINEIHTKTGCKTPFQLAMFLIRNRYLK